MRIIVDLCFVITLLCPLGCKDEAGSGGNMTATTSTANAPTTDIPRELVGSWEHGSVDFARWENYQPGYYAGRNATPMREAMVIGKNGEAKYYRYEFAFGLYEELIDCDGIVSFNGDETFVFSPVKGRKRHIDTRNPANTKDRALTIEELSDPKLAGKRSYAIQASSERHALRITVPGSAPYNWYKKP